MSDSKAITKIQSIILIAIIVIAAVGASMAYIIFSGDDEHTEPIKIGILALIGLESFTWQSAISAAEQLNAEGGILGRQVELIMETCDGQDMLAVSSALTRLITYHKADFIFGIAGDRILTLICQDIIAEHKKIFITITETSDDFNQQVLDNNDKYKYYFNLGFNTTSEIQNVVDSLLHCGKITDFTKIGYLAIQGEWSERIMDGLDANLHENGFELVYKGVINPNTIDFASYFAAAEAAGVEILVPLMVTPNGIPFVKEYFNRQSPMVVSGIIMVDSTSKV